MDKAKKMAEQAQAKLDEVQGQFNSASTASQHDGPAVEYDKHGRPIQPAPVDARRAAAWRPPARRPRRPACRPPSPRSRRPARRRTRPRRRRPGDAAAADRTARTGLTERRSASGLTLRDMRFMRPYEGLLTAMVTPFRADGSVDEEAAVAHRPAPARQRLARAGRRRHDRRGGDDDRRGAPRLVALIVARAGRRGRRSSAGTGSNDTRHAVHLTEARRSRPGADAVLSVTPYYNKPNRRGIVAPLRGGRARRRRHAGDPLQHPRPHGDQHAARPARRAGPDRRHRGGQAGQLRRAAADRRPRRARRQRRHLRPLPGHRRRRRHLRRLARRRAARCGACTTSRSARAEIDASLREVYAALFLTASPAPRQGGAEHARPRRRAAAAAAGRVRRARDARQVRGVLARHGLLQRAATA